jgi:ribonuclease HI
MQSAQQQQRQLMHWTRPPINWYKYNVDAGFQNKLGKTSMGWCIRDLMGQFALAGTSWLQGEYSIIEGGAIVIIEAMKEVERRCFANVIFKTDSKSVVDATR